MSKQPLTQLTADLDIVQSLDDLPNTIGGLTAEQLKAKFDEAANLIKTYINTVLLAELASESVGGAGASRIGLESLVALGGASNVQDAFAAVLNVISGIEAGVVTDGSITTAKLADLAVTSAKIANGAVGTAQIANSSITGAKTNFAQGVTIDGQLTQNGQIRLSTNCYGNTLPATATAGRLYFKKL